MGLRLLTPPATSRFKHSESHSDPAVRNEIFRINAGVLKKDNFPKPEDRRWDLPFRNVHNEGVVRNGRSRTRDVAELPTIRPQENLLVGVDILQPVVIQTCGAQCSELGAKPENPKP